MPKTIFKQNPTSANSQYEQRDLTLQEVADCFDVTRERIRQIEAKALRKMRQRLMQRGNKEDFFI